MKQSELNEIMKLKLSTNMHTNMLKYDLNNG